MKGNGRNVIRIWKVKFYSILLFLLLKSIFEYCIAQMSLKINSEYLITKKIILLKSIMISNKKEEM